VGTESLHKHGDPLHHRDIFPFLWEQYKPDTAYVGFFLGYDFTMWLRSLTDERARRLLSAAGKASRARINSGQNTTPFPVFVDNWELDLLGMKRFKLRAAGAKHWMYINDVGAFFQTSFLNAIDPLKWSSPIVTQETYDIIEAGKNRRDTAAFDNDMIRYNVAECVTLAQLMDRLNCGFVEAEIRLHRDQWYGPGQAAQQWMSKVQTPTGNQIRDSVPELARDAARASYYGGWFEIFRHGTIKGTTFEYDINSAYPYITSRLPCLLHGEWTDGKGDPPDGRFILVHADVRGSDPVCGTMPHRTANGSRVLRPYRTRGWYWKHEIDAGIAAGIIDELSIDEWVRYTACDCPSPLRGVETLYDRRLEVGKATPQGIAYKLMYNSMYGKLAQSIGSPRFSNPIWASLITSGCRMMILNAIATHPQRTQALVMVATDGVYFSTPHPSLPLDAKRLGAWDVSVKQDLTVFMPGIYWDQDTRSAIAEQKSIKFKSRGVNARVLAPFLASIDAAFTTWIPIRNDENIIVNWPQCDITLPFLIVSPNQALAWNRWGDCGMVVRDVPRLLSSNPRSKRSDAVTYENDGTGFRTIPHAMGAALDSTPYKGLFGEEIREQISKEFITPEGDLNSLIMEVLRK